MISWLVLMPVVVAACSGGSDARPGPSAVSSDSSGWKIYRPGAGQYEVALPADWKTYDATSVVNSDKVKQLMEANPNLRSALNNSYMRGVLRQRDTLLAVTGRQTGTNVLIMRVPLGPVPPGMSDRRLLRAVDRGMRGGLTSVPNTGPFERTRTTLGGEPAVSYTFSMSASDGEDTFAVDENSLLVVHDGTAWIFQTVVSPDDALSQRPVFAHIQDSFAFR